MWVPVSPSPSSCPALCRAFLAVTKTWMAGHRRAEATPSFGRLCPAMKMRALGSVLNSPFDLRLQRILDDAIEGRRLWRRLVALLGDELVALCNQCREFLVQCVALLHLLVEFVHALLGLQRAQFV